MGIWIAKITKFTVAGGGDKTAIMLTAGTNHQLEIMELAVMFYGVSATQAPIQVQLVRATTAGTSSVLTLEKWNDSDGDAADAVGAQTFTAEPTTGTILLPMGIHPQTGIILPFPEPLVVGATDRLTVLVKDPVSGTDMSGWLKFRE